MSKYKSFGATLLAFWIFFFIVFIIVSLIYINLTDKIKHLPTFLTDFTTNNTIFPYIFLNKEMLFLFIFITLCIFVFTLVHGIYIFSKKKRRFIH